MASRCLALTLDTFPRKLKLIRLRITNQSSAPAVHLIFPFPAAGGRLILMQVLIHPVSIAVGPLEAATAARHCS